ncbi:MULTISPECIES: glycoside hydrolase family 3 C-terminal domain-containing protein [Bacteroides]|uniref:glycoside hydrolase family 3 C-terminal domain-containing protein n=1 Tax=Bacteroides TaxID=816 RepID=UPI00101B9C3E|nr:MULTISPECIES: glycoside hydrolase family 3 C-terminal domain-containing protein [Bacteroides]
MNIKRLGIVCLLGLNALGASAQKWFSLEVEKQVNEILSRMTVEEKLSYLKGADWMSTKGFPNLGISPMKMSDGPQGLGTHGKSTAYPATVALAATWNKELAYEYGEALGRDCNARSVNILLGPAVNIYRAPFCGRNFEYMGEDPYLAGQTAANYIKGVQDKGVVATVKHFVGNNSDYDRHNISNDIDERTLFEIYFPAFKAAVQEAEVGAVMTSYNLLNGLYTTEHPWLIRKILRDCWGFNGLVMSDWGSLHYTVPGVKAGLDLEMPGGKFNIKDLAYYLKSGDISMEMIDEKVRHILRVLIGFGLKDGKVVDSNLPLDDPKSAATALKVAQESIVLLKNEENVLPINPQKIRNIVVVGKNAHGYVHGGGSGNVTPFHYISAFDGIKETAEEYGVEVKYMDELDFQPKLIYTNDTQGEQGLRAEYFSNKDLKGTPVTVQNEKKINYSWGDGTGIAGMPKEHFSVRWSGIVSTSESGEYEFTVAGDDGYRFYINNELLVDEWHEGGLRSSKIVRKLQAGEKLDIRFEYFQAGGGAQATFTWRRIGEHKDLFVESLNKADMVIACFGHTSESEREGTDRTFTLPEVDAQLMARLKACKVPVIGVVNAGGNVEMQGWEPSLCAMLWTWYAGQEAGRAIGEILFGKVNPSGKLPMTFEKKWEDNPAYLNYHDSDGDMHVAYTEGIFIGYRGYDRLKREVQYPFGFGLSYTTFKLSNMTLGEIREDGSVDVRCRLVNTGKRAGAQVVQVYVGKTSSQIERPEKELRNYKKVFLQPGESAAVTFTLPREAFTYYSTTAHDFVVEPGEYRIILGFSSKDIQSQIKVSYQ